MGVRGELFSIVVSDCFDAVSERQKHACAGLHDRVRVLVRQFGELGVFGGSLDMRHDNAFVIGADNRVGLPVSDAAFCGDNRRPLIDIDAVRNQPAPRILALAPVVFFAAVTQVKIQRAPVFLVFPDMLIDALVTDKGDAILRQTPADLIGTPLLLRQFFFDQLHQIWRHFARLVRGLFASLRGLLVRLLEAIAARAGVANKLAADRRRIDANLPRNVGLRVAALQERVNLAALFAGQMEIAFGHFSSVRCAVPRKDSLHLTARKTGIHNMAKSGGRKRRPQGCSLRSHRLRRLKPLTPTLSPATHSAMPSMLPCCTSDLKRRDEENDKRLGFFTNNFELPALTIAQLYKCRWQVELFFKWIKQHLRIKAFFGTNENAVKTQIWIAISVYVLVAIVKKRLGVAASLYTILQILSLTLFEKTPLDQLLNDAALQNLDLVDSNQLNFFS